MPDVVLITWEQADRPRSGGSIRSLRLMQGLARRCELSVVVVGPAADAEALRSSSGAARVTVHPIGDRPLRTRWWSLRHGWPLDVSRRWSAAAAADIRAQLAGDARVVVEHVHLVPYVPAGRAYVLSTQNAEHALAAERPPPDGWRRVEHALELRRLRRFERRAVQDPRATVVTVSAEDAAALDVAGHVVPNGADIPPDPPPVQPDGTVLYVGSLGYPPNADAVRWWASEIWPRLGDGAPPLTVVGRDAGALADLRDSPAVRLVGEVADVGAHLAAARLVVVPLRYGSGTRLKVLEAMAWRRPVVSTSKGVEGLPVRHDEHLVVADDPDDFAASVARVRADAALADRLVARARPVAEAHAWPRLADHFADVVLGAQR